MAVFQSAGAAGVAVGRRGCIIKGGRGGGRDYFGVSETKNIIPYMKQNNTIKQTRANTTIQQK